MRKAKFLLLFWSIACIAQEQPQQEINAVLDTWHNAAAEANFDTYFSLMSDDAVFIGTDATENWDLTEFKAYSKPHFDKGKAWNFTLVERNVYVNTSENFAWFDELLNTQMKICRGSGILKKVDGKWKIGHYVLSIAVPNEHVSELIEIKKERDNILLENLNHKKTGN
ncbi:nuclear transport factor 2 family protein [Maribacter aestuarii]|uniref:nuclear transport factor 2 family protein n=1 Tax=Maribacter aestuarii TaxID=1130723 RepID=UPI00248CC7A9|nr:nuclear transport factor 2 family protein [Maribacter aestuarii]